MTHSAVSFSGYLLAVFFAGLLWVRTAKWERMKDRYRRLGDRARVATEEKVAKLERNLAQERAALQQAGSESRAMLLEVGRWKQRAEDEKERGKSEVSRILMLLGFAKTLGGFAKLGELVIQLKERDLTIASLRQTIQHVEDFSAQETARVRQLLSEQSAAAPARQFAFDAGFGRVDTMTGEQVSQAIVLIAHQHELLDARRSELSASAEAEAAGQQ